MTDMRMPRLGGPELIRTIRVTDPELPVVVTTGYSEAIPHQEPGLLTVIMKPYKLAQVTMGVGELLSRS